MQTATTAGTAHPLEQDLPPVAPLPPLVSALTPLEEGQYDQLFKHVVRAIKQRPWTEDDFTPEDLDLLVARAKRLFRGRSSRLSDAEMNAIIKSVDEEPLARAVLSHCVAFTSDSDEVIGFDEFRAPANFFDPREATAFLSTTTEVARKRLEMSNRTLGVEYQLRQRTTQTFEYITSGKCMGGGGGQRFASDVESDFQRGCFGGLLQIELMDICWRKENAAESHSTFGLYEVRQKLQASVQLFIDDEPKTESTIRGFARETVTDPASVNTDDTVDVNSTGTARFWKWQEPASTTLFIGSEALITAPRARLVVHIKQPRRFGCFAFDEITSIEAPLETLYSEIMPIGDPSRRKFNAGYHFTYRHHVDAETGMGVTMALNLQCTEAAHNTPPHFFDPEAPVEGGIEPTARQYSVWQEAFHFPHHSALLHLFEMCDEVADVEYEILNAYRDFFFLDPELYHIAVCIARAKSGDVRDVDDLRDALKAVELVSSQHPRTRATEKMTRDAIPEIKERFMNLLCEPENFTRPNEAAAAVFVAREILQRLGLQPHEVSAAIREVVTNDLAERSRYPAALSAELIAQRSNQVYGIYNNELGSIGRALRFANESKDARVVALVAHRIACQLEVLVPFLRRFMKEATDILVSGGEGVDPFGETFCVLSSIQQRTVDCFKAIRHLEVLRSLSNDLLSIFDSFLTVWLTLSRPRMMFCVTELAHLTPLEPISERSMYSQAPGDAMNILTEVIDFFWQCAMCAAPDIVVSSITAFSLLVCDIARRFVEEYTHRLDALDSERGSSKLPTHEVIVAKLVGICSLGQFVELLQETTDEAMEPGRDLLEDRERPFDIVVPKSRQQLADLAHELEGAVRKFAKESTACRSIHHFVQEETASALRNDLAAIDNAIVRFNGFIDLMKRAQSCLHIENHGCELIAAFGISFAVEASLLPANQSNTSTKLGRVIDEVHRNAKLILASQPELFHRLQAELTVAKDTLNMLGASFKTLELTQLVLQSGSPTRRRLATNVLCLRAEAGDTTARSEVSQRQLQLSRTLTAFV